ncbi:MAG: MBL fold metallo-hydrolase [Pseudomonadota bacterium]
MLTRRDFSRLALAGGATALAGPTFAKAPFADGQVAGIYRHAVGDIQVTALLDGYFPLPVEAFFNVSEENMAAVLEASAQQAPLPTAINAYVINTADRTFLVDAGFGSVDAFGPDVGKTVANLQAAGIEPGQVDAVILTHAHLDHCEGLVDGTGAAVFPDAELIMAEAEHAFWTDDAILAQAPEGARPNFESARRSVAPYEGRTTLVGDADLAPGVRFELSPGHTPGHGVLRIESGDDALTILADSLHNEAIHLAYPDAGFGFDVDPAAAAVSRRRQFDRAADEGTLTAGSHISFPSFGRIVRDGDAYAHVMAEWDPSL